MRKLALLAPLALVAVLALAAPIASAADFPALLDGGSLVAPTDAGFAITVDTRRQGYQAVVRCQSVGVYYRVCDGAASQCATGCGDTICVPTQHHQYLAPDTTYDISVPGGHNQFGIKTFDGGVPSCNLLYRRDLGE